MWENIPSRRFSSRSVVCATVRAYAASNPATPGTSILPEPGEIETWMTAPWDQAKALQRPLPDGALVEVLRGAKKDEVGV